MATVPSFSDGGILHAADLNFLETPPQGGVNQATPQAALATGVTTVVTWDTLAFDTDTVMWSSGSRLQLNTGGKWLFTASLRWASNATGYRFIDLRKNAAGSGAGGSSIANDTRPAVSGNITAQVLSIEWPGFIAGDYVELFGFQTSGGSLAFAAGAVWGAVVLTARWMGA